MAAKKVYVRVRIDKLEYHIARVRALGRPEAEQALRYLARDAGADLNDTAIAQHTRMYEAELQRWREQDEERKRNGRGSI